MTLVKNSPYHLGERLPAPETGDDIEQLSVGLNRMIARLDESFQHIHHFSAEASHELRMSLTVLRGELEAATQHPKITPELRETLGGALKETERFILLRLQREIFGGELQERG